MSYCQKMKELLVSNSKAAIRRGRKRLQPLNNVTPRAATSSLRRICLLVSPMQVIWHRCRKPANHITRLQKSSQPHIVLRGSYEERKQMPVSRGISQYRPNVRTWPRIEPWTQDGTNGICEVHATNWDISTALDILGMRSVIYR